MSTHLPQVRSKKETLVWDRLTPGDFYHLVRSNYANENSSSLHDHDFPELFWIDRGKMEHEINGTYERIVPMTLYFIRPSDTHRVFVSKHNTATVTNFSFSPSASQKIWKLFPIEIAKPWNNQSALPEKITIDKAQLLHLQKLVDHYSYAPKSLFYCFSCIIQFFEVFFPVKIKVPINVPKSWPIKSIHNVDDSPNWLESLEKKLENPILLHQGVRGLSKISGFSSAYISRVFRKKFGCTPSNYINRRRVEHAAYLLQSTQKSIIQISHDCGLPNLSHFYKLFHRFYKISPGEWRKKPGAAHIGNLT